jgi:hypothetical protein
VAAQRHGRGRRRRGERLRSKKKRESAQFHVCSKRDRMLYSGDGVLRTIIYKLMLSIGHLPIYDW